MKGSSCFPFLSSPEGKAEKSILSESIFTPDAVFSQNNRQLVFCSTPEESKKELKGYHTRVALKAEEKGKPGVMVIIYLSQHPLSFADHLYNTVNLKSSWTSSWRDIMLKAVCFHKNEEINNILHTMHTAFTSGLSEIKNWIWTELATPGLLFLAKTIKISLLIEIKLKLWKPVSATEFKNRFLRFAIYLTI